MKEFFVDVKAYTLAKPLNCKGTFQKLHSGFCPLRGGEYPPFPLRVFGQDDFPLRGGGQSQKKQKLSGQQDFCRKNFPDKALKLHKFSNLRQKRVKVCLQDLSIIMVHTPYMHHGVYLKGKLCALKHFIDFFNWIYTKLKPFLDQQETFQTIKTFFRSSENFPYHPDTFFRLFGHCLDYPETFQINRTHFLDYPDTF